MKAQGAGLVDTDAVRQFDSNGRLLAGVIGKRIDDSLRRSRGLPVVNQFRRYRRIDSGLEGSDP